MEEKMIKVHDWILIITGSLCSAKKGLYNLAFSYAVSSQKLILKNWLKLSAQN